MGTFRLPARQLLSTAPDAILVVDAEGRIRWCNEATEKLFGYAWDDLEGRPVDLLVPDPVRAAHAAHRAEYETNPTARPMGRGRRLHGQRSDRSTFVLQIALSPIDVDGEHFTAAIARDMTDWIETEGRLERAQRRQHLAEERERIARDLHDTVIQELFAAGMSLQGVVAEAQPERVAQRISDTIDTIDGIIRTIRGTIFRLQQAPEAATRVDSLHDLVSTTTDGLGFTPELVIEGNPAVLGEEAAASLEVVVREALSNVARHARATSARVEVRIDSTLHVRVIDDGIGLPDPLHRVSGLANLRDRARTLGGTMVLSGRPGGGTVVDWRVPVDAVPARSSH
jgi:PAS domain S-box-containing protein